MVFRLIFAKGNDLVMRLIKRGANEIVHAGIHDDELAIAVGLAIEHARQQKAGLGHDGTARLDEDLETLSGSVLAHSLDEFANGQRFIARLVRHPQAAAQIQSANGNTASAQALHQRDHLVEDLEHGRDVDDLRCRYGSSRHPAPNFRDASARP